MIVDEKDIFFYQGNNIPKGGGYAVLRGKED